MPKPRLLTMGLLDKYPLKSKTMTRFLNAHSGIRYTDAEKQNMVALWFMPELPHSWVAYQFEARGYDPEWAMNKLRQIVYKRAKPEWRELGQRNVLMIGQPEVERYYERRNPNMSMWHPSWAIPIFNENLKQGMSQRQVAAKYGMQTSSLEKVLKRGMFAPHTQRIPPNWGRNK